ncbi:DUF5050 domain-containing protein [Vallitalea sp.]|jgi:hypothetical protein|uniref:DUF5050 domain-containing protein n=1 Tax=Vallitalea sp. TaxID=1882829 RepID=UPI0025D771AC|nr:DUF5050 domain-containing protein [Vallitalea sp.]MCT4686201.1 DUF5050 domain-containing protein [Vallitalea sp.]
MIKNNNIKAILLVFISLLSLLLFSGCTNKQVVDLNTDKIINKKTNNKNTNKSRKDTSSETNNILANLKDNTIEEDTLKVVRCNELQEDSKEHQYPANNSLFSEADNEFSNSNSSSTIAFYDNKIFYVDVDGALLKSYNTITNQITTISDKPVWGFIITKEKIFFSSRFFELYQCDINGSNLEKILSSNCIIFSYCNNNIIFDDTDDYLYKLNLHTRAISQLSSTQVNLKINIGHCRGIVCYKNDVFYTDVDKNFYRHNTVSNTSDLISNNTTGIYIYDNNIYYSITNNNNLCNLYRIPIDNISATKEMVLENIKATDFIVYKNWLLHINVGYSESNAETNNKLYLYNLDTQISKVLLCDNDEYGFLEDIKFVHNNKLYYTITRDTPDPIYFSYNFDTYKVSEIGDIKNIKSKNPSQ